MRILCADANRNKLIVEELVKAVSVDRKILVLSERRKHLERIRDMFASAKPNGCTVDFYVGGRSQQELDIAANARVIFSTYQMAREALDIPSLDTLFMISPVMDVEQSVGRIMREFKDKKVPLVTDFIDAEIKKFLKLWNERRRFYISQGMFDPEKEK